MSTVERRKCDMVVDYLYREKKTIWQKTKHVLTRNEAGTNPDRRYYTHTRNLNDIIDWRRLQHVDFGVENLNLLFFIFAYTWYPALSHFYIKSTRAIQK